MDLFISTLILWFLFVNVMMLKTKVEKSRGFKKILLLLIGYPIAIVGILFDALFNIVYGTLLFMELPHYRRLLLTARLKHIILTKEGWRLTLAIFICKYLIEPWDFNHCGLQDYKGSR